MYSECIKHLSKYSSIIFIIHVNIMWDEHVWQNSRAHSRHKCGHSLTGSHLQDSNWMLVVRITLNTRSNYSRCYWLHILWMKRCTACHRDKDGNGSPAVDFRLQAPAVGQNDAVLADCRWSEGMQGGLGFCFFFYLPAVVQNGVVSPTARLQASLRLQAIRAQ